MFPIQHGNAIELALPPAQIIERLFREQSQWKSRDLVDRVGSSLDGPIPDEQPSDTTASVDDAINDFEPIVRPDKEVGAGCECVYLYFNPNDRRLAELEGGDVWECKIGRTGSRDAIQRILGQGI